MTGLVIWLVLGLVAGLVHSRLPGARPPWWKALLVGIGFALTGGLLATVLGIGGVAAFDPRSTVVSLLAAIIGLNLQRLLLARRA